MSTKKPDNNKPENDIRISMNSRPRYVIKYALSILKEKNFKELVFSAVGGSIGRGGFRGRRGRGGFRARGRGAPRRGGQRSDRGNVRSGVPRRGRGRGGQRGGPRVNRGRGQNQK